MTPSVTPEIGDTPLIRLSTDFIRAKEYLEAIVSSTSDAICTTDTQGRVIYFSPGAERMLKTTSREMAGRPAWQLYAGGREEAERIMRQLRREGMIQDREMVFQRKDGSRIHVSLSASLLRDRVGRVIGTLGISKDITRRVELEKNLLEASVTDGLTGLYNRRCFDKRLALEAGRARRQGYPLSLILADMDGFKSVNDERGHLEGDRLLKRFADSVRRSIRSEVDAAFRTGGDEFHILTPGLGARRAREVALRIAEAGHKLGGLSFSFGIATLTDNGSPRALVREADEKMYQMKRKQRAKAKRARPA